MSFKHVIYLSVATATLSGASTALAMNSNYYEYQSSLDESFFNNDSASFVIGLQGGYANEHWDNFFGPITADPNSTSGDVNDTGFSARGYVGYNFNPYLGTELGYVYLPKTTISGFTGDISNYAIDLLAKLSVQVSSVFSLYAKAGGSYFHSNIDTGFLSQTNSHVGPAFGVGAAYEVVPNFAVDLSWMRYSGEGEIVDNPGGFNVSSPSDLTTNYQPNPDVLFLGISYKFPTRFS